MLKSNALKIELKAYDDLFETDASRAENKLAKIRDIPISEIDDFPDHPFKVRDDEDMTQLVESIKERGIITPATVRLKDDGRYELISGHRRKRACELAGFETLRAEVVDLSKDNSIILMVDSNLQRSTILPSERAFSYKMRLEAMNRQGERTDLTCRPVVDKLKSVDVMGVSTGESGRQIQRYIRLTSLIPDILQMVDDKKIAFRPAVEISYLQENEQYMLLETMECEDCTPSLSQAIKMKEFSKEKRISEDVIFSIMSEEKPNQKSKPLFDERITKWIPKSVPKGKESDFIVKAVEHYNKYLQRNKDRDR
ncbi:MAG: ParB/RepB/Spo0J family partition protein [Clostridia bacterium]